MQILDSLIDGAQDLPERDRERLYRAYIEYLRYGREPDYLSGAPRAVWVSVLPNLDNSRSRVEAGRAGGSKRQPGAQANGQANGKQTAKQTPSKTEANGQANGKQTQSKTEANEEANGLENGKRRGRGIGIEEQDTESVPCSSGARTGSGRCADPLGEDPAGPSYAPPTPGEVEAYVEANGGNPVDGTAFVGWYADHGWPARDWRGTAMRWSREDRDRRSRARGRAASEGVSADEFAYLDGGL